MQAEAKETRRNVGAPPKLAKLDLIDSVDLAKR